MSKRVMFKFKYGIHGKQESIINMTRYLNLVNLNICNDGYLIYILYSAKAEIELYVIAIFFYQ